MDKLKLELTVNIVELVFSLISNISKILLFFLVLSIFIYNLDIVKTTNEKKQEIYMIQQNFAIQEIPLLMESYLFER